MSWLAGFASAAALVVLCALVLVLLRERRGFRGEADRRRSDALRAERDALRSRLAAAEQARRALERRVVEPAATLALLNDAAERLETLDEAALYPAVLEIVERHLHAEACAVYAFEGGRFRRKAFRAVPGYAPAGAAPDAAAAGAAGPPEERDPTQGLVGLALRERRVVSARDLVARPDFATQPLESMLAAPFCSGDGTPLGVIEVASIGIASLTAAAERIAGMVAAWTGRAAERIEQGRSARGRPIYDQAVGALRYEYFGERLVEEFERARRYAEPFAILVVELLAWDAVPPATRETLRRAVAQAIKNTLRRVDIVYLYKDERSFAVTLPHTPLAGAEHVRDRIAAELDGLAIEPYRRTGMLEFAIGVAAQTAAMRSPSEMAAAAESACDRRAPAARAEGEARGAQ